MNMNHIGLEVKGENEGIVGYLTHQAMDADVRR